MQDTDEIKGNQIFTLNKTQQKSLDRLLDLVCPEESKDYIVSIACYFREEMDWNRISATLDKPNAHGSVYHLNLNFPLQNKEKGFIKIYVWRDADDNYSVGLSSTTNPDFALHRYNEGEVWDAVKEFYQEIDVAMAAAS